MNDTKHPSTNHGKYLISPLTKALENGWYACSVSVRSGIGRGTTDRVLRLTRLFQSRLAAAEYALAEGMRYIRGTPPPLQAGAA